MLLTVVWYHLFNYSAVATLPKVSFQFGLVVVFFTDLFSITVVNFIDVASYSFTSWTEPHTVQYHDLRNIVHWSDFLFCDGGAESPRSSKLHSPASARFTIEMVD